MEKLLKNFLAEFDYLRNKESFLDVIDEELERRSGGEDCVYIIFEGINLEQVYKFKEYFLEYYQGRLWKDEFNKVKQCAQSKDSLRDQMKYLVTIADRFGFSKVSDYLKSEVR